MDQAFTTEHCRPVFDTKELDFEIPHELIAQIPLPRREDARMLLLDRGTGSVQEKCITDLADVLAAGDLLVLNDTKVLRAKFEAFRETGGKIPGLFLEEVAPGIWKVMLEGGGRLRSGETLHALGRDGVALDFSLLDRLGAGQWRIGIQKGGSVEELLDRIGSTPLPPYIDRRDADNLLDELDRNRYQTVYARRPGAVAAPTAGLHLTEKLLGRLAERDVETAFVTLHVAMGTFKPVKVADLSRHPMYEEWCEIPESTAVAVNSCRRRGGRVVAVGTTCVRTLESGFVETAGDDLHGRASRRASVHLQSGPRKTKLLIYPPHDFQVVDALLTNFHLPRSTLLALVMALAGVDRVRRAYRHAIEKRYRFFSYGDAMLIV